jgi:radical SAM superfamily enzyme YgiQ (UPF0313 family)
MRALLVQPRFPSSYWSFERSLPFIRKAATHPPLGLATLAAHLPPGWSLRLRDLNVTPLLEADLAWADVVLVSGMLVQADSMREVLRRARAHGRRTVVGGPAATSSPEIFPDADHLFQGEAEGRLDLLVSVLEAPGRGAPRLLSPEGDSRPELSLARVPRFDLLDLPRYANQSLQYSRGCPFHCEFCSIVELFGHAPRVKSPEQVLAELEALYTRGARGSLFFVDDNFVGNRREVARLLPAVRAWQERRGFPFELCTEASLDLASSPDLVAAMVSAGFVEVFLGIETPSASALAQAGKRQNLRMPSGQAVELLTRAGLEVFAGFIVGLDGEEPDIFDRQLEFISALPIPRAMVGVLTAMPGTRLWHRLQAEGRLRGPSSGDAFGSPNFVPSMDERKLLAGYRRLLEALYSPGAYYARCALTLEQLPRTRSAETGARAWWSDLRALARILWGVGVRSPRRRQFWPLLLRTLGGGLERLPRMLALAVIGESLIDYTREVVLPRIDRELLALGPPAPARRASPAPAERLAGSGT